MTAAGVGYGQNHTDTGEWFDPHAGAVHDDADGTSNGYYSGVPPRGHPPDDQPDDDAQLLDSWAPIDLGPHLRGEIKPMEPSIGVSRTDGLRLLYSGKEHTVIGEMESGKSWFCLACVAAELAADRHVVYIHFEESEPSDTLGRLIALGCRDQDLLTLLRFVGPERRVTRADLAALLDPPPSLVILDGVNEAMALHGWGIRDEDGAAEFRRRLVKPCTSIGAATLAADHVVKNPETRGRYGIGSVHKGNGLTGAQIMLENADPFGRGQRGRSHVFITKDRPGWLRRHGRSNRISGKTFIGELVVDDTGKWMPCLDLAFYAPKDDPLGSSTATPSLADTVLDVITKLPERQVSSERQLLAHMRNAGHEARTTSVRDALDDLVADGRVEIVVGRRGAKGYRATASHDQTGAVS